MKVGTRVRLVTDIEAGYGIPILEGQEGWVDFIEDGAYPYGILFDSGVISVVAAYEVQVLS